jgi:hypothetical protein
MKRALAFVIAATFVAGCSGVGGGSSAFVPGTPGTAITPAKSHHRMAKVSFRMRIPRRHRRERAVLHPATISASTQSVTIAVNGGAPAVFNATPASPNCAIVSGNTTCTFSINAPVGSDTFVVSTYNAQSAGGTLLDRGTAVIAVVTGTANTALVTLGPIVTTTADSGVGSLRYAIANANAGDSIMFMLPAASTITVGSPLTLPVNLSIAGPGVTTSARRHNGERNGVTFSGVTISGGGTQQIFIVNSGITATIAGVVLSGGLASTTNQPGGAIYNAGTLTLSNDGFSANNSQVASPFVRVVHHAEHARHRSDANVLASTHRRHPNCTSTYYGGAVYNHGSLSVSGSTFDSNVLQNDAPCSSFSYGAAIYNDQYGTLVSSGNTYSNNSAYEGAAVYNNSAFGQASFTGDTFTGNSGCTVSTGCAVSGCGTGSGSGCTTAPTGFGAAIYDAAGPGVTIASSTFSSNVVGGVATSSSGDGGALYLATGSPSVTASSFSGNVAGGGTSNCSFGEGGAIYEDAASVLELDNDTFTGNSAGGDSYGYGGAIYNNNDPDHGSGNTFSSNTVFATGGGSGCAPSPVAAGGAVYAGYGISMSSSAFNGNNASATYDAWGGALYTDETSTLTSNTFNSNTAIGTGLNSPTNAEAYGGAVYAGTVMRMTGNTFTSNSATALTALGQYADGGAVYANGTLTSNGDTFTSNSVSIPAGIAGAENVYGGAIYMDANIASSGDKFSSNSASGASSVFGGALSLNGSYTMSGATFTSNTATATAGGASGGAVEIETAGTLSNSTFTGNSAVWTGAADAYEQGGGAIYDYGGSKLNGLTMTGNSATSAGGALYVAGSIDQINSSTISGNSVVAAGDNGGGGAIYGYVGFELANSTVSANTVAVTGNDAGGGAVYVDDTGTSVTGSTLSGNSVTGTGTHSGGGAIFNFNNGRYTNDTIAANTSSKDGGGFEDLGSYNARLTNVTMYQNTAAEFGGNIFNDNDSSPYLSFGSSIIAGGSATGGGPDVYNSGRVNSSGYNVIGAGVDGGGTFSAGTGDQLGTDGSPINPQVLALSNNGGPTFTMADTATSPGVGKIPVTGGSCNGTGVTTDQRGFVRGTSFCDVGAYELNGVATAIRSHPVPGFPGVSKHPQKQHHRVIPPQER